MMLISDSGQLLSLRLACLALLLSLIPAAQLRAQNDAAGDSNRFIITRPGAEVLPGPGPNRIDRATSDSYRFGLGDQIGLMITFRPTPSIPTQAILPNDVLKITYHFGVPEPDEPYRIQPFDNLYLQFRYSPELSQQYAEPKQERFSVLSRPYTVQADGSIVLAGINQAMKVIDLTSSEVKKRVELAYKGLLEDPQVGVSVDPQFRRDQALKDALGLTKPDPLEIIVPQDGKLSLPLLSDIPTKGRSVQQLGREITDRYRALGYQRLTVNAWFVTIADERHAQLRDLLARDPRMVFFINDAGKISVPLITAFPVVNKTARDISEELTRRYQEMGFDRVEVAAWVDVPRSRVIRVLGEVNLPGVYSIYSHSDLWGAIALAGGFTRRADAARVRMIPRPGQPPQGPFDFNQFLRDGSTESDPLLRGDETVYVPAKGE